MPQPADTKSIGFSFVELQAVDSTNNYARQQIHAGLAQHGTVIFAHEQLSGKGQRGKSWSSEKDANITLSIIVNPRPLLITQQFMLNACIGVSVHEFFKQYAGAETKIKWPNDLYWQDRKAGGVLIESLIGNSETGTINMESGNNKSLPVSSNWKWSIIGIGININQTVFPADLPNPVSLKQITGKNFNVVELAKKLCLIIDKNFRKLTKEGFPDIYDEYINNLYKKNAIVKLKKDNLVFDACIISVSPEGKLIIQHAIEEEMDFGKIEWLVK